MDDTDPILLEIDRLIRQSRLKEIEFIMSMDATERVHRLRAALGHLDAGAYLLGTGPSTVGIVPLNGHDIVLGRPPTILESPSREQPDYYAVDTLYFVPREISRTHAKVMRRNGSPGVRHILIDLHSTCGTFVNETRVDPNGTGAVLEHGDIISLGPSQTNTYVYFRAGQSSAQGQIVPESSMVRVRVP
jgi:hypothetical protein